MIIDVESVHAAMQRLPKEQLAKLSKQLGEGRRTPTTTTDQREQLLTNLLARTGNPEQAQSAFERILEGNDLVDINYLEIGTRSARSVCRIRLCNSAGSTVGFATGFLVAPRILLTNHHVVSSAEEARGALAEFDYQYDTNGRDKPVITFAVLDTPPPLAVKELDFCLVALSPKDISGDHDLDEFAWLPLNSARRKAVVGEYLTIIQHPAGGRKQVCVRENKLMKYDDAGMTLWYKTDTVAGSSGSPVFNLSWDVVALHHSGVPDTDKNGRWLTTDGTPWDSSMDESRVRWLANEGIRVSSIIEYLQANASTNPLSTEVLRHLGTSAPVVADTARTDGTRMQQVRSDNGELFVTIPVQIGVRVGLPGGPPTAIRPPVAKLEHPASVVKMPPVGIEKVSIDQSNYKQRKGYDPDFLGDGPLQVPLPEVKDPAFKKALSKELKYWNYSVVMNKDRRFAIFSAVNVDTNQRPPQAGREGDSWYFDPRLKKEFQIGPEFYAGQREFEVDRSETPFDRGHLTRRLDATWGHDAATAKKSGDDTFHWTNCTPQHWRFNQGAKKWLGLEDYVIQQFASQTGRACIITGPVFDAPLSTTGEDGRLIPDIHGKRHKDPVFGDLSAGGASIPKLFFKVIACERASGELTAAGFLMSQEDFLSDTGRIKGMGATPEERLSEKEARLYQVSIADLAIFTGLNFGPLAAADALASAREAMRMPQRVQHFEEFKLTNAIQAWPSAA